MSNEKYHDILKDCVERIYTAVFLEQESWKRCASAAKEDVLIYKKKEGSGKGSSYVSKAVVKVNVDSNTVLSSYFDKQRTKEYDSYWKSMACLETIDGPSELVLNDGTRISVLLHNVIHTNYRGYWPLFSPRDAVHLMALVNWVRNDVPITAVVVASIPDDDAKKIPMLKHVIRAKVIAAGCLVIPTSPSSCVVHQLNHMDVGGWVPKKAMEFLSAHDVNVNVKWKQCVEKRGGLYTDDILASGQLIKKLFSSYKGGGGAMIGANSEAATQQEEEQRQEATEQQQQQPEEEDENQPYEDQMAATEQ